jgi:hypothetical protein
MVRIGNCGDLEAQGIEKCPLFGLYEAESGREDKALDVLCMR